MGGIADLVTAAMLLTGADATDDAMHALAKMRFQPQVVAGATRRIPGAGALFRKRVEAAVLFTPGRVMACQEDDGPALASALRLDSLAAVLREGEPGIGYQARIGFGSASCDQRATPVQEEGMTVLSAAVILKDGSDTRSASNGFTRLGFEVRVISEGVLLLTADASVFENGFDTSVAVDDAGPRVLSGGEKSRRLPPDALPETLREQVAEIEFEAPPDFGPTDF